MQLFYLLLHNHSGHNMQASSEARSANTLPQFIYRGTPKMLTMTEIGSLNCSSVYV